MFRYPQRGRGHAPRGGTGPPFQSFEVRLDAFARRSRPDADCARRMTIMSETAIVGENVEVIQTGGDSSHTPFSWSAAIAGAFAATAVAFIIVSLGSGVGLQLSSPYSSGPSL